MCGGVEWWEGGYTNNHYNSSLSWVELRVDQNSTKLRVEMIFIQKFSISRRWTSDPAPELFIKTAQREGRESFCLKFKQIMIYKKKPDILSPYRVNILAI